MEMKKTILTAALTLLAVSAFSQSAAVSYSLPQTVLVFEVEAVRETFAAGPYALYARKYLGIRAEAQDRVSYKVTSVKLTPAVEADQSVRYSFQMSPQGQTIYLQLTSQGLISGPAGSYTPEKGWKYPAGKAEGFSGRGVPSNLSEKTTTLIEEGNRLVQQSVVVEKTTEAKAKEVADKIFEIRDIRYKILVGDTDASYSGEAMKAIIDALDKLEADYLKLFTGYSSYDSEKSSFELIPTKGESQMYIAFRLSDEEGLVPADNVSGKPYIVSIGVEEIAPAPNADAKGKAQQVVYYRIPSICNVRLGDGVSTLLQTRVPIYQLGIVAEYPVFKSK